MDIAHHALRVVAQDGIADGVDEVRFAQARATVDEERVVGAAGVARYLLSRGPGKVVGLADHQVVEGETGDKAGLVVGGRPVGSFLPAAPSPAWDDEAGAGAAAPGFRLRTRLAPATDSPMLTGTEKNCGSDPRSGSDSDPAPTSG